MAAPDPSCVVYALHLGDRRYRYVGLTRLGATERLRAHRKHARQGRLDAPVYRWMRKHGWDNVQIEVLEAVATPAELDACEMRWITALSAAGHDLLNCTAGGRGMRVVSPEVRAKLGANKLPWSEERRALYSGSGHHWYGKTHTVETRAKMSANNAMRRPEVSAKIRAAKLGVPLSEETKRRIRETKLQRPPVAGNHFRWHVDLGKWAENCEFCRFEVS